MFFVLVHIYLTAHQGQYNAAHIIIVSFVLRVTFAIVPRKSDFRCISQNRQRIMFFLYVTFISMCNSSIYNMNLCKADDHSEEVR